MDWAPARSFVSPGSCATSNSSGRGAAISLRVPARKAPEPDPDEEQRNASFFDQDRDGR